MTLDSRLPLKRFAMELSSTTKSRVIAFRSETHLRGVVHDVAAAAACDGPTPPPPPRKQVARGSRHGGSVRSPLPSGFRDAAPHDLTKMFFVLIV